MDNIAKRKNQHVLGERDYYFLFVESLNRYQHTQINLWSQGKRIKPMKHKKLRKCEKIEKKKLHKIELLNNKKKVKKNCRIELEINI